MINARVASFPRTVRALPLPSLAAIGALVAAPTVITVIRHGHDLRNALVTAAVVGGAGLAYAVDDDAALVLAPSPAALAVRRATRILGAALIVAIGWTVVVAVGWSADLLQNERLGGLVVEAITAAGVAVAVAAWTHRELGLERTGMVGATTAVVLMIFVTVLALRYPWLPVLGESSHHDRWLWVAAIAWAGVWWTARDPANRRRRGSGV